MQIQNADWALKKGHTEQHTLGKHTMGNQEAVGILYALYRSKEICSFKNLKRRHNLTNVVQSQRVWTVGFCELTNAPNERCKNKSGMLHCTMGFVHLFLT